jgi:hypothetical protein
MGVLAALALYGGLALRSWTGTPWGWTVGLVAVLLALVTLAHRPGAGVFERAFVPASLIPAAAGVAFAAGLEVTWPLAEPEDFGNWGTGILTYFTMAVPVVTFLAVLVGRVLAQRLAANHDRLLRGLAWGVTLAAVWLVIAGLRRERTAEGYLAALPVVGTIAALHPEASWARHQDETVGDLRVVREVDPKRRCVLSLPRRPGDEPRPTWRKWDLACDAIVVRADDAHGAWLLESAAGRRVVVFRAEATEGLFPYPQSVAGRLRPPTGFIVLAVLGALVAALALLRRSRSPVPAGPSDWREGRARADGTISLQDGTPPIPLPVDASLPSPRASGGERRSRDARRAPPLAPRAPELRAGVRGDRRRPARRRAPRAALRRCYVPGAMRASFNLNRHRPLAPDALTSKYRSARDAVHEDELHDDGPEYDDWWYEYDHGEDDYWSPARGWTADDYLLFSAFEEAIGLACKQPKIGHFLPPALARRASPDVRASAGAGPGEARPSHSPDVLGEALFAHVDRLVARARTRTLIVDGDLAETLDRRNGGMRGVREALACFPSRPGPVAMALLFVPFWVRPIASWRGPSSPEADAATLTRSLVEHLFQVYPVPRALHQPWLGAGLPGLKWVVWLVLLGQGGNLHHAARRFGWSIAKRFTHHFAAAPDDLTPLEACMWAEVARAGGDRRDFERVLRRPGYVLDPTAEAEGVPPFAVRGEDEEPWEAERRRDEAAALVQTRAFWQEAVSWLVRFCDRLTDEASVAILEWALHLHTESVRPGGAPGPRFRWSGREPAAAHAAAEEYLLQRAMPYGDFAWKPRGLDWETGEGEAIAWTVRELTTSRALAEESRAMHHCVGSYAYRCAQGQSAIFSFRADGVRRVTVEVDPLGRIVQARGACNRAATTEEQAVLARWLAVVSSRRSPGGAPGDGSP